MTIRVVNSGRRSITVALRTAASNIMCAVPVRRTFVRPHFQRGGLAAVGIVVALIIPLALFTFVLIYGISARGEADDNVAVQYGDPSTFLPGDLDLEAIQLARQFTEFPILWLGESFDGFALTNAMREGASPYDTVLPDGTVISRNTLALSYGSCTPTTSNPESHRPTCVVALQILVDAGNVVPPPEEINRDVILAGPYETRGVTAMDISTGTTLWFENGLTVTVHGQPDMRREAVAALTLANASALGAEETTPGSDLSRVGRLPITRTE
ncbi:MAG: hypothetical protein IT302_08730 [Dehalococcoidia bacterium]|nr:hypothetical protein [Dehalococcoidia bacterium]